MGMTIDDADTILSCERLDSSMGCGASDEDIDEALGVAIDTMRKYQKIQNIVTKWYSDKSVNTATAMLEIKEVIKNG